MKRIALILCLVFLPAIVAAGPPGAPPSGWQVEGTATKTAKDTVEIGTIQLRDNAGNFEFNEAGGGWDSIGAGAGEANPATVSQAEAEAGTETGERTFTPQRVFQAIAAWITANLGGAYDTEAELDALFAAEQDVLSEGAFVDGDKTKLDGIETAADVTDATNVAAAGALMDSGTDNIDDTHVNWGTGAGQVSGTDIPVAVTNFDGVLSGSDTTVLAALETIDDMGADYEASDSNDFDPDRLAGDTDDDNLLDASLVDINGATTETNIAADDKILIYDTSATANRGMTRGNFISGIGAGQAVIFDIGDDGGNDSTDLGEIATDNDTNNIITLNDTDKMLIDMGQNWPTADTADAASSQAITDNAIATVDDADAADNDFAKFTAAGLEGRSYAETRQDLGIDTAANLETSLSLGAYASDILGAADSDALVTLLGLQAGDIPDLSATYEAVDTEILRADTNDSISADYTITGNWVNTTNPWADNEVSDTITVGNAGTVDPDAISGDTTDDDLIDQDVIEGFAGVSDPYMGFRDSDAAGADEADEEAGRIYANLVTATEDAEDSDMWFTIMQAGSRVEVLRFDESDDQWETTKNIVVPDDAYDATDWNGNLTVPTKNAVRDQIEGLAGTGTMTTVEDGDSGVGGADIVTLDFDGTVFNITESPDTEINIDIADDGLDSQHYAGASVDPEHISSGAWDFGTSVEADTITEGGVGVINTGETEVIDSDMYVDASIDPAHVASGTWDFGTSVEADTLTEGGNAVWNDADTDVVDDTHLNWASMTYLGEEGQPTAAAVGLASENLDDTDASIEWEDAADLESDGAISDNAVDYSATAGSVKALTPVVDAAADFAANFTGANLYGGTFICDTTGTIQLPAVAAGMNFTIITKGAIAVVVEPNASDMMMLDGTDLDDADSATNLSTAGDIIVFQYMSAAGWIATSNGWTDED
jgi:hypothetical protein